MLFADTLFLLHISLLFLQENLILLYSIMVVITDLLLSHRFCKLLNLLNLSGRVPLCQLEKKIILGDNREKCFHLIISLFDALTNVRKQLECAIVYFQGRGKRLKILPLTKKLL